MNPPIPNFYDPENARQLAEFAAESYSSFSSLPSHQIEDPATDTRVVLWQNTTDLVIAFRGTADLRNWLTDADCAFRQADGCKIHAGFWCALDSVWIKVRDAIDVARDDNKRVWLTGHSLGGALALLCAWRYMDWRRANPLQGLYTFGQPRVGDAAFAKSWPFQAGLNACAYRVINQDDIVPHIPWLLGRYRHAGHELFYGGSATVPVAPAGVPPDGRKAVGGTPNAAGGTPALPILDRPIWRYAGNDLLTLASLYLHPQNIGKILAAHHVSRYVGLFSVPFVPSVPLVPALS